MVIRNTKDCDRAIERQMDLQGLVDTGQVAPDELESVIREIEDLDAEISYWEENQIYPEDPV